jgi:monoamine oxidase
MTRITRRAFLQTATLAGAGAALTSCTPTSSLRRHDVVIVGAGIAGLAAGRDLSRAGLDVLLLEARPRVGGRMETQFDASPHGVETGALMIHGSRANTWELIREFGIETRPLFSHIVSWGAKMWTPGQKGLRPHDPARQEAVYGRLGEAYRKYRGADVSYKEYLDTLQFTEEEQAMVADIAISFSAEPADISLQSVMEDSVSWEAFVDENFLVVGGNQSIAEKVADEIEDRIRLASTVKAIDWKRGDVEIRYEREGHEETAHARKAILTLPIGVLQTDRPAFSPVLPGWKRHAIDSLRMGRVVVVQLLFDEPFWREREVSSWSSPHGRVSWLDPHAPDTGAPAILGVMSGQAAQELSDLGEEAGLRRALSWIEDAFPDVRVRERVEWSYFRDWVRDPYSLGSYSFTLPGRRGQRGVLATPVESTLHFAGEAMHAPPHYQTVHGAYVSGRRAAREILSDLGLEVSARALDPADVLVRTQL